MMNILSDMGSQFASESEKNQLKLIRELAAKEDGLNILMEFLLAYKHTVANLVIGKAYQAIYAANTLKTREFLASNFPQGIVPLNSERNIDYAPLLQALLDQDFELADLITLEKLCELAGALAIKRKWLYFTEVDKFPATDLQTINQLWLMHSEGKFGFSVQRQLWLSLGCDFPKLWVKIGWKNDNNWTRYPREFTWNLTAPKGHLPTSNQLRGTKVINSLFSHPVWQKEK